MIFVVGGGQGKGPIKKGTIVVTYPAGATCTVTNGNKTYTALDTSGAAAFVVEPGTWTVTFTSGSGSKSESVTVEAGGWVGVELRFGFYLYKDGDEYPDLTGGWQARAVKYSSALGNALAPTLTKNSDNMSIQLSLGGSTDIRSGLVEVIKDIDLTGAKTLRATFPSIKAVGTFSPSYNANVVLAAMKRNATYFSTEAAARAHIQVETAVTYTNKIMEIDISQLSGLYDIVIGLGLYGGSSKQQTVTATVADVGVFA